MRELLKSFNGKTTNVNPSNLKPEYSPDCSDIRLTPNHNLFTRNGFDKVNTVSFNYPITLIDQIENDGTYYGTYVMGTNMYGFLKDVSVSPIPAGYMRIHNCEELQAMQDDLTAKYILMNDIDCTYCTQDPNGALYNAGAGFMPVGLKSPYFTGIFDGNGHTITELKISRIGSAAGLFGAAASGAVIQHVGMIDANIHGQYNVGAIAGTTSFSTITNCFVTGSVSGTNNIGGICGSFASSTINTSYSAAAVSGISVLGGLTGFDVGSAYNDCFWDTQTSGQATSGGGTGKTTVEMKQEATFTNWDFTTIWAIVEDVSYPTLR